MNNEPVKKFMDKITDTSEIPFAMATLDKSGNIKEFGPYQIDFAHEIPHIPLYTHPANLTDEVVNKLWAESSEDGIAMQQGFTTQQHYFAYLILRKASEK